MKLYKIVFQVNLNGRKWERIIFVKDKEDARQVIKETYKYNNNFYFISIKEIEIKRGVIFDLLED